MRVMVGIISPAPVGVFLLTAREAVTHMRVPDFTGPDLVFVVLFAYLFVGVQSIIMSLLMELWINPKVESDGFAVAVAATFGAISFPSTLVAVVVGAMVGAIVGGAMRCMWVLRVRGRSRSGAPPPDSNPRF